MGILQKKCRTTGKKALAYRGKGGQNTDNAFLALRLGVALYLLKKTEVIQRKMFLDLIRIEISQLHLNYDVPWESICISTGRCQLFGGPALPSLLSCAWPSSGEAGWLSFACKNTQCQLKIHKKIIGNNILSQLEYPSDFFLKK